MGARGFYATIADNFFRIQGATWNVSSCEIPLSSNNAQKYNFFQNVAIGSFIP